MTEQKYFIKLEKGQLIEVNKEVYITYYQMARKERYQYERDKKYGLLYYDSWDTSTINGQDYVKDFNSDIEKLIIEKMRYKAILNFIEKNDKEKILQFIISIEKENEIAKRLGITQAAVSKKKNKLLRLLKDFLEK